MKKILLIGGGGHARSVVQTMGAQNIAGYVAIEPSQLPTGVPYLGDDNYVESTFSPEEYKVHVAVGFNNGCSLSVRRSIIEAYGNFEAATLIAPSATVMPDAEIKEGTAIMAAAVVNCARIGKHCVVNTGAIVEHDCNIGNNVFIGPGAIICGEVTVGNDVFIGAGAVIRNGVSIADGVSIGMGAVVTRNITEPGIYVGNPIRKKS
ncbi:MAG: acetyltransferase [Firmicutes bacterium]|nr:acetyltransferase [Bacillota bacterium]MCM1401682.1 acetyltransferase [Bacteroides sp.]MCM1477541.1 acetyltransferase [Bacteroides sp.]